MKWRIALLIAVAMAAPPQSADGYEIRYREQFYRLYHYEFYQSSRDIAEVIFWLESALAADFANPLNAIARIETEREWERYRYLFTMHLNLLLVQQVLLWGAHYNKFDAFFYNAPFRDANLESLDRAESLFRYALGYWEEAVRWSEQAEAIRFVHLEEVQAWEDESFRIATGDLDYDEIIREHLRRLEEVRAEFEAMDDTTY